MLGNSAKYLHDFSKIKHCLLYKTLKLSFSRISFQFWITLEELAGLTIHKLYQHTKVIVRRLD